MSSSSNIISTTPSAGGDAPTTTPRVVAVNSFFDGIPPSVAAQLTQLASMHAIQHLSTNDHTRNGVVSSLVTTVLGIFVTLLGGTLRNVVIALVALTVTQAPKEETRGPMAVYNSALTSVTANSVRALRYTQKLAENCESKVESTVNGVVTTQFMCSLAALVAATKMLYHSVETSNVVVQIKVPVGDNAPNMYGSMTATQIVSNGLQPSTTDGSTIVSSRPVTESNQAYGVVCLTPDQIREAFLAARASYDLSGPNEDSVSKMVVVDGNDDDDEPEKEDDASSADDDAVDAVPPLESTLETEIQSAVDDYLKSPVYLCQGSLYTQSLTSFNLVFAIVRAHWAVSKAALDREKLSPNDGKNHMYDLIVETGPSGQITYGLSPAIAMGRQYRLEAMFLECKSVLLNMLDKFRNKTLYPSALAMTNKFGIVLFGPPGTGKTNTIRAIANHLGRRLLRIDCSKFIEFNEDEFRKYIGKMSSAYVIELDEFDHVLAAMAAQAQAAEERAMLLEQKKRDWMMSGARRSKIDVEDEEERKSGDASKSIGGAGAPPVPRPGAKMKEMDELSGKNNLGPITANFLLRWLDGLGQDDDRVIIMCTNNPQNIHPDFFRPGRIDLKMYCGFCTTDMMINLLATKFPRDAPKSDFDNNWEIHNVENHFRNEIEKRNVTPLNFINTMSEADTVGDFMELINELPCMPDYPHKNIFESNLQRQAKIRASAKRDAYFAALAAEAAQKQAAEEAAAAATTDMDVAAESSSSSNGWSGDDDEEEFVAVAGRRKRQTAAAVGGKKKNRA